MAFKEFVLPDIGRLTVYKRRGVGSLRLSVRHDGSLRVTVPGWMPFRAGVEFAQSRREWIAANAPVSALLLADGQLIGKAHRLHFVPSAELNKPATRVKPTEIIITYPPTGAVSDPAVQQAARQASIRALKHEAEHLLPMKVREIAGRHRFEYRSVSIRQLKSRWGSCDQDKNITLSLFLMLLPWELIEYVVLHELTHTRIMKHGPEFWQAMTAVDPRTPAHRKAIRAYKPTL